MRSIPYTVKILLKVAHIGYLDQAFKIIIYPQKVPTELLRCKKELTAPRTKLANQIL